MYWQLLAVIICVYLVNCSHKHHRCYSVTSSRQDYEFYHKYIRFSQANNITLQIKSPLKFIWKGVEDAGKDCGRFPEKFISNYQNDYRDHCQIQIDPKA